MTTVPQLPDVTEAGAIVLNAVREATRCGGTSRYLYGSELTAARKLVRDRLLRKVGSGTRTYALTDLGLDWVAARGTR